MENSNEKQEHIKQLNIIHDNAWAKYQINKKINQNKDKLKSIDEELYKFKENKNNFPSFFSSYSKLKREYERPKYKKLILLDKIIVLIYILIGILLVGWSGYQIVSHNISVGIDDVFNIILNVICYEVFLILLWLIGLMYLKEGI